MLTLPLLVFFHVERHRAIDPLRGKGADLQDLLMKCDRMGMGEIPVPVDTRLN